MENRKTNLSGHKNNAATHLLEQVRALAGAGGGVSLIRERPWASITFTGTRHILAVQFEGEKARENAMLFAAILPSHEFILPRCFVADAVAANMIHIEGNTKQLAASKLEVEILTIEDI